MTASENQIEIRNAMLGDAEAIAKVHIDTWRTAYRGIMPDELLDNLHCEERRDRNLRILADRAIQKRWFVATHPKKGIVGFCSGGPSRDQDKLFHAELYSIYILSAFQRVGLGRQLFQAWARQIRSENFNSAKAWVLEKNASSRRFYERMGGQLLDEKKSDTFAGKTLTEVAYGWNELHSLAMAGKT